MSDEPVWLRIARADIGLREIKGAPTAPKIAAWLQQLGAWWRDDEQPWCGTCLAAWMKGAGLSIPKAWYRALAWAQWGAEVAPTPGAVVVFQRPGGGHVGLLVGRTNTGALLVLGGNQSDAVCILAFNPARVVAIRWPIERLADLGAAPADLPLLAATGPLSRNEA
ncbi:MAG TPA: TIGR02594 family protein [Dehalococcoidia bacterium]|nr:TIGR02594 family protein [Dehalococcoidia bacterium]